MKRNPCRIGLAATLALGFVSAAASAENRHYQVRGNMANVTITESTGCISTSVFVAFYDQRFQQPPGAGQQSGALDVYVSQHDNCQNVSLFNGEGSASLPVQDFSFAPGLLKAASLTTSVEIHDRSTQAPVSVSIDLGWTGVGEAVHGTSRFQMYYPQYKYMSHTVASFREAEVTGTVLVGSTSLAASGPGYLNRNQTGFVTISN